MHRATGDLRVATYNVLTLRPEEWRKVQDVGLGVPGTLAALDEYFNTLDLDVVVLNETRLPYAADLDLRYYRFCGGPGCCASPD